jgi:mono/diheme cytochrome c family protein
VLAVCLAGCTYVEPPKFRLDLQGRAEADVPAEARQTIANYLTAAFGTPDEPFLIDALRADRGVAGGLDLGKIELAAGPALSEVDGPDGVKIGRGLYRQHCVHCHGVTGDGAGPTAAFLNPQPRDYRRGVFKFKSTERPARPTTEDLKHVLYEGIPGTAMPSFRLLADDELDALVEYVRYLAVRGETEIFLRARLLDEEDVAPPMADFAAEFAVPVLEVWAAAEGTIVAPPERPDVSTPELLAASIARGKTLYRGDVASCVKCHGPNGLGDGSKEALYDDWNKDKKDDTPELWLLAKAPIQPRNLRLGEYRGGRRPLDLYRRIHAGIAGTPMPESPKWSEQNPKGLKPEEIWDIVNYVQSLPYEPFGAGAAPATEPEHGGAHAGTGAADMDATATAGGQ